MTQVFDFQSIFDLQPNPAALVSFDGEILHANHALLKQTGMTEEEIRGIYFSSILLEPFTRESFTFFKSRFKEDGKYDSLSVFLKGAQQPEWTITFSAVESGKYFLASFMPLSMSDQNSFSPKNIGELSKDYLKQKLQEQEMDHLIYIIGHDLRAPMRAILGFSQILKDMYKDVFDEEGTELVDIIQENTRKLNSLVSDLVDFSRISRMEGPCMPIDLGAVFRFEYNKLLSLQQEGRDIDFELNDLLEITSDPSLVKLIVIELLSNAILFTQNQPSAWIKVGGYVDASGYTFYVSDNGIGFDMNARERIFGIFEKLVLEEDYPGNGIGLSRVNKAVKLIGGRVWTESTPGEGSTFYVFVPQGAYQEK